MATEDNFRGAVAFLATDMSVRDRAESFN